MECRALVKNLKHCASETSLQCGKTDQDFRTAGLVSHSSRPREVLVLFFSCLNPYMSYVRSKLNMQKLQPLTMVETERQ